MLLAVSLLMVVSGFYLKGRMESAAQREATATLSAEDMLELNWEGGTWFNERQAQIHNLYTLSAHLVFCGILFAPPILLFVFFPSGGVVAVWRTVLLLEQTLSGSAGRDVAVAPMSERPSRSSMKAQGKSLPMAHWLFGRAIKDPTLRTSCYGSQHVAKKTVRLARVLMWTLGPPAVLIMLYFSVFPLILAHRSGIDWYTPLVLFGHQYIQPGTYHAYHLFLTNETWERFFPGLFMLILYLENVKQRPRGRTNLRLGREMRRLDILLWRKARAASGGKPPQ